MTSVLCIILFSYLFMPIVASNVVVETDNQNPSWVRMVYTEEDFSFSAVVSDGTMTIGTQTGEVTDMIVFACDSGMLMYDDGFKLIYQSAGNTVVRESDATAIAVSCTNKTVTVIMGGVTYSMPMTWAYYPHAEGIYSYFSTDSYNFKQGDPVAVFGDFAGVIAYNTMLSQNVGLDFKATVQGKHLNNMHWAKLSEGESATDIGTVTGTSDKTDTDTDTDNASNTESAPISNVVTGSAYTSMSVMNAGPSTVNTAGDWQYVLDGTDAIITGYTGTSVSWLTVPATVGGYSVKQVGNGTEVLGSVLIRNLEISEGIQVIGDYAFKDADIPDLIKFPASLTSIGDYAFAGCTCDGRLNLGSTHVVSIGDYAFDQCSSFTGTLVFPSTLVTIGDYAFRSCWSLSDTLTIPSSVTTIGDFAFNICQGFNGLTLMTGIQTIGESAFESCTSMGRTLIIPPTVTSIGDYAFYDCKFTTVSVNPASPTIGQQVFAFDTQSGSSTVTVFNYSNVDLSNPIYGLYNAVFKVDGWQYRIIWEQSGGEFTSKYASAVHHDPFTNVSITIPSSVVSGTVTYDVKQIGDGESAIATITNCTLVIPSYIERINANAFKDTGLTGTLTIPNSVTAIGDSAFSGCAGLTGTLVIPNSVTTIGDNAFNGCSGFTSLTLGNNVQTIPDKAFVNCGFKGTVTIPLTVTEIGIEAFKGCSDLINLIVFSNPTVGTDALANTGIKEVLNLGTTEFTKTSYGLNADEVRTDIQADGCIAIIHDVQEKKDIVSTLMKVLPILIFMVILVLIARPLFGMDTDDDESGSGSDDYEYY